MVAEDDAGIVPAIGALQLLDRREVDGVEDDGGRVQAAEAARGLLVEHAVVVGARLPAHAADEADGLHRPARSWRGRSAKAAAT